MADTMTRECVKCKEERGGQEIIWIKNMIQAKMLLRSRGGDLYNVMFGNGKPCKLAWIGGKNE